MTQLVLPGMRRQGWGKIVNLSSMGGKLTFPGGGFYHATKHAVEALSDALRFEVRGFGIDVIVIEPGPIKTRFGDTAIGSIAAPPATRPTRRSTRSSPSRFARPTRGPMARFAAGPEAVAEVIESAIVARRPALATRSRRRPHPDGAAALAAGPRLRRLSAHAVSVARALISRIDYRPLQPR